MSSADHTIEFNQKIGEPLGALLMFNTESGLFEFQRDDEAARYEDDGEACQAVAGLALDLVEALRAIVEADDNGELGQLCDPANKARDALAKLDDEGGAA